MIYEKESQEVVTSCSGAEKVKSHSSGYTLPVPDGNPVALLHQGPDLLEDLGYTVAVSKTSVASDGLDGGADAISLGTVEAGGADDHAWDQ